MDWDNLNPYYEKWERLWRKVESTLYAWKSILGIAIMLEVFVMAIFLYCTKDSGTAYLLLWTATASVLALVDLAEYRKGKHIILDSPIVDALQFDGMLDQILLQYLPQAEK